MAFTLSAKSVSAYTFSPIGKWIIPRGTVGSESVNDKVNKDFFYSCVEAVGKLLVDPPIGFRLFITNFCFLYGS